MTCKELVELVTDYLEGRLPPAQVEEFEQHLELCEGCVTYVDQIRATMDLVGSVGEDDMLRIGRIDKDIVDDHGAVGHQLPVIAAIERLPQSGDRARIDNVRALRILRSVRGDQYDVDDAHRVTAPAHARR